jgi:BON domain
MHPLRRRAAGTLALAGGLALLRPGTHANKVARRQIDHAGRRLRYLGGRLRGASYRLGGRTPDPNVDDSTLADRIRSTLGPLEKRLDIPHVHVMVTDHVAHLHGEVPSAAEAAEIERAVVAVSGVTGVESSLHVGLAPGDTRPSAGRAAHQASHT